MTQIISIPARYTITIPCILAALGAGCSSAEPTEPVDAAPEARVRLDAPPHAMRGPFAVGYRQLETSGAGAIKIESWYPALNPSAEPEDVDYEMTLQNPAFDTGASRVVVYGHALVDAPIDDTEKHPLVIFSHGFSLNPEWYSTLLEHYASHGFVVLAPEHVEQDWLEAVDASFDRPLDVRRTLDLAEQLTASDGAFAGRIDMQDVAVVGHSYGGYTALAMAGARFDLSPFQQRCAALSSDDPRAFVCAPFLGKESDMAARAGLDQVPEGLWPSLGDPRVTAIVPIAGDAYLFNEAGLANVTIPIMAIGGTMDFGTPFEWGSQMAHDYASSERKALVAFGSADHLIATNPCEIMPWTAELSPFAQGLLCFDPVWDKARALDLIKHFSTAFLLDVLKEDEAARAALMPDAAQFSGIAYTTTLR